MDNDDTQKQDQNIKKAIHILTKNKNLLSTLMSKMEYFIHEKKMTIFRTEWGRQSFYTLCNMFSTDFKLDIDRWIITNYLEQIDDSNKNRDTRVPAHLYIQGMQINWLLPLLDLENTYSGILNLLYTIITLEDETCEKLTNISQVETEYCFDGVCQFGKQNAISMKNEKPTYLLE